MKKLKFNVVSESNPECLKADSYTELIMLFQQLDPTKYFDDIIGHNQIVQKNKVKKFQTFLLNKLASEIENIDWKEEYFQLNICVILLIFLEIMKIFLL